VSLAVRELNAAPGELAGGLLLSTEPVVLRGLVTQWPAVQAGLRSVSDGAGYLRDFWRKELVCVMAGTPAMAGRFFYNEAMTGFNFERRQAPLPELLDQLLAAPDSEQASALYVGSTTVDTCLPGFRAHNDLALGVRDPLASIWLGNRSRIAPHYDLPDNLACVTAGRRRFTLFPPEQLPNLYVGPLDFTPAGQPVSLVDLARPDLQRYPRFSRALAAAQVAELAPGDAIFIPSMWWHQVESLERFNVLINYWWRSSPDFMDSPVSTLMLALLTLRELPPAQRRAWQAHFQHYIFEADAQTSAHVPVAAQHALAPLTETGARQLRAQLLKRLNR
jgi:hypothetical protein